MAFSQISKQETILDGIALLAKSKCRCWAAEEFIDEVKVVLEEYDAKDIFNCNETGLFYKMMPNKIVYHQIAKLKKRTKNELQLC